MLKTFGILSNLTYKTAFKSNAYKIIIAISSCLLFVFASPANATSFDCTKARTWVENTICDNSELSMLDEKMSKQYQKKLAESANYEGSDFYKARLRKEQLQWLKYQRNTCKDDACLVREYKEHIGEKASSGTFWGYTEDLTQADLPSKKAFGKFYENTRIDMYNPDTHQWDDAGKVTNTATINRVDNKPYLAIVELDFIFNNAHTCDIGDAKATWWQNHWVINHYQDNMVYELRLYPQYNNGKTKILLRDIDNNYRTLFCGVRGYLNGIELEAK